MNNWHYIVLGLCLVLLVGLLWMELRRAKRARLFLRCVAVVVAVAALACLGLPIYYWRETVHPAVKELRRADAVRGIVGIDWKRKLNRGERLVVQGNWAGGAGRLLLMGMGEVVDSAGLRAGQFSVGVVPAQLGRAVYRLIALVGKDTVEQEDIPVEVGLGVPLKILVLAGSPDFENRFLIKWLSDNGHSVASRTMVSRGKAEEAFVNREVSALSPLTPALLGGFDLVVADVAALPARGTAERNVLDRQVREKGLGLLLKMDSAGLDSLVHLMKGRVSRVVERDTAGKVVAGALLDGSGKLVFTALNSSYSRLLSGDGSGYAAYWVRLLRAARVRSAEEWSVGPELPRVGEEVRLELQTGEELPQGIVDNKAVYLAQDAELGFLWRGKYWPDKSGWQLVYRPMGDTAWWYVWPVGAWENVERGSKSGVVKKSDLPERERVEFPKGWFWGLFLSGVVFLWVERKISGMNG